MNSIIFSATPLVESAIGMLEEWIVRLGIGYVEYWFLSAAFGLMPSSKEGADESSQKQKAVERATRLCYRVLSMQDDLGNTPSLTTGGSEYDSVEATANQLQAAAADPTLSFGDKDLQLGTDLFMGTFDFTDLVDPINLENMWPYDMADM